MLKVGLTGGIGSGKTTVSNVFSFLKVPVYESDVRAKWLMNHNPQLKLNIVGLFGEQAYFKGELNRKHLSEKVFGNTEQLKKLNYIVHPVVAADFAEFCKSHKQHAYVIKEAAILFESGAYKQLDKIITVFCPVEERIKRVMERDNISREEVLSRIAEQMPEDEKIKRSDFVIYSDEKQLIIPQVLEIHEQLSSK